MAAKIILALCASALFVQVIAQSCSNNAAFFNYGGAPCSAQGNGFGNGYGAGFGSGCSSGFASNALGGFAGYGYNNAASSSGGALPVASASPIYPSGVSVLSENAIEGAVNVYGQMPFLSAVALEGQVPSSGAAITEYGCGNGNVGIINEGFSGAGAGYAGSSLGYGSSLGFGSSLGSSLGYGSSLGSSLGYGFGGISGANFIAPGYNGGCGC